MFKSDALGNWLWFKRLLMTAVGLFTYPALAWFNRTKVAGTEHLKDLPPNGVLFVCNHQTVFMDIVLANHALSSGRWFGNRINNPVYLPFLKINTYFVAARETMSEGLMAKTFRAGGAVMVQRTWRTGEQSVQRKLQLRDQAKVALALREGWVFTFPQGTTRPYAPGRSGTAHLIKRNRPVVVPIVFTGMRDAFNKKGTKLTGWRHPLSVTFKPAMDIDYEAEPREILDRIMDAIEQSEAYWPEGFVPEPAPPSPDSRPAP